MFVTDRLKKAWDKDSNLLQTFENYGHKKFYNVGPRINLHPLLKLKITTKHRVLFILSKDRLCIGVMEIGGSFFSYRMPRLGKILPFSLFEWHRQIVGGKY